MPGAQDSQRGEERRESYEPVAPRPRQEREAARRDRRPGHEKGEPGAEPVDQAAGPARGRDQGIAMNGSSAAPAAVAE